MQPYTELCPTTMQGVAVAGSGPGASHKYKNNSEWECYLGENEESKSHAWLTYIKTYGTYSEKADQTAPAHFSQAEMHCLEILLKCGSLDWVAHEAKTKSDSNGWQRPTSSLSGALRARGS